MASSKAKTKANGGNGTGRAVAVVEIAKPVVVPSGAPSISDSLPDVLALHRCTFADAGAEQLAAVCAAFHMSREIDRRLETVTEEDLIGHRAYAAEPPRAALVRSADAAHVTLVAEGLQYEGQKRDRNIEPVCAYFLDRPGCLPEPPRRSDYEMTDEARARARQCWGDVSEEEAAGLYAPTNIDRFRSISAERVEVAAVMYRQPSGSGVLWIKHRDLIWPVSLVRREALRRAEPPATTTYTVDEWNHRSTSERGVI